MFLIWKKIYIAHEKANERIVKNYLQTIKTFSTLKKYLTTQGGYPQKFSKYKRLKIHAITQDVMIRE